MGVCVNDFSTEQIKAARMLLGWDQSQLAMAAGVGIATVKRIETGKGIVQSTARITDKIRMALQDAGIEFLGSPSDMPGVRLTKGSSSDKSRS
jgi:transcriptional regulator with XRE-family HTH domain